MSEPGAASFNIYLVRHANAAWPQPGARDFDRKLDERGRTEAHTVADRMAARTYQPDYVICSPAARCVETLDILKDRFDRAPDIRFEERLYTDGHDTYLELIATHARNAPASLMIIGHNPMMEETSHALLQHAGQSLEDIIGYDFPTAGFLALESCSTDRPATAGHGRFMGLLSPRER
ncbi:histidine phosphatase family protein [Pseudohoeflea suaedae]|uniref:Histidine phosphatase family protein n=1 Tax=Pseudohoeflea suaedae TaxID=877384 RepID=A0A4R5PK88_9HYPH|nr:histidine phosphatase family protein [Pseudohoeflea suaedae]TDH36046.1 histidine phosphatase family protein [Pseudohoeflea suaedae]